MMYLEDYVESIETLPQVSVTSSVSSIYFFFFVVVVFNILFLCV